MQNTGPTWVTAGYDAAGGSGLGMVNDDHFTLAMANDDHFTRHPSLSER